MRERECVIDGFCLWVEGDVLVVQAHGSVTPAIAAWLETTTLDLLSRYPHYYMLGDLREAGAVPAVLRRRLAEHGAQHPPRAIALYHVGLVVQGINAMLFGAMNLFSKRKQPVAQCKSEAEARAWLETQRPRPGGS